MHFPSSRSSQSSRPWESLSVPSVSACLVTGLALVLLSTFVCWRISDRMIAAQTAGMAATAPKPANNPADPDSY